MAQDRTRHDLPGCPAVFDRSFRNLHLRRHVNLEAEISEGHARPELVTQKRGLGDRSSPVRLRRIKSDGCEPVKFGWVKRSVHACCIELIDCLTEGCCRQAQLPRQLVNRVGLDWREHRRHEEFTRLCIDDRVSHLVRLCRNQAAPDCIALGPHVLALVVEPLPVLVHDDREGHAIQPGHDTAIEFGCAAVDGHGMTLGRIADACDAPVQQVTQHFTPVCAVCREFPPRHGFGARSSSSTDLPASRAEIAAQSAALPPPTTRTSGDFVIFDKVIARLHVHDSTDGRQTCIAASRARAGGTEIVACVESGVRDQSFAEVKVHGVSCPLAVALLRRIARAAGACQGGVGGAGMARRGASTRAACARPRGSVLSRKRAEGISRCSLRDCPE